MSRTTVFVVLLGIAGCAEILGFKDLHERDVVCGAEAICKEPAPAGWTGPVAVFLGDPAAAPSCGTAFPDAVYAGNHQLSAPPAQCGACTCNATGASCTATLIVKAGESCTNICDTKTFNVVPGQCVSYNWSCGTWNYLDVFTASGTATCTAAMPKPQTTKPLATWAQRAVACGAAPLAGTCPSNEVCMPTPQSPFPAKLCIYKSGDEACPAGAYQMKTVTYDSFEDTRDCGACGCGAANVNCGGTVRGIVDNSACTTPNQADYPFDVPKATCIEYSDARVWPNGFSLRYTPTAMTASCPATGGEVIGEATPTGATTICCEI